MTTAYIHTCAVIQSADVEDDFQESVGVERLIQALHSHTWSNLVMKGTFTQINLLVSSVHIPRKYLFV